MLYNEEMIEEKEQLIVIPLKSFNGIEYGTNRDSVWKKLGKPNSFFKKTNISKVKTDEILNL